MYMYKKTLILSITIAFLSQGWAYAANEEIPIIDLGTAKTDNSGYSSASGISADGSVAIGVAETNSGDQQAFRYNVADASMVALGTLKADNSGYSQANAISANGDIVVGLAETDTASQQAFRHNKGDAKMTGLGTLKTDNSGYSTARAVSADGQMVVGAAETDAGTRQAFRHNQGDAKMTGLGTLKADNSGSSNALDVSADGRVVVGDSSTDIGNTQAFRHNNGDAKMTALGTLVTDNSGYSSALAVSASGRVTVGVAETDSQDWQAFRHNEGDTKMTGLGTLKSDNSGFSIANAVSADGLVVVGDAEIDAGNTQAFRHNEGDIKMTGLGTLTTDNSGNSSALAVSADGRVVVGNATTDSGDIHAFRHNEGDAKMTDLGTLKTDNSGTSTASAVSADGSLVVGVSDNDFGQQRAVIWKTTKAIDIENNYAGMNKTASKAAEILDLYQNTLLTLADSRCQLGESNYCLGAFTQYNNVHRGSNFAGGLYGAIRLPSENWTIGGSINLRSDTDLVKNYNAHGNTFPGIGLFTRYQANKDNSGFTIELAGSYIKQNLSISRERLNGGEAGKGNSSIKGYMGKMTAGYGFNLLPQTQLTPLIGIQYSKVSRDGYTENSNADFLAHYNKLSNKTTDLQLGLNLKQQVSKIVSLEAEIGERINLKSQRNDFKASMDYFGTQNYQRMKAQHTKPYARLGTNIAVTKNSTISTNVGWSETDYRKDASFVGVGYSYHW